jgi:hypothetical protein
VAVALVVATALVAVIVVVAWGVGRGEWGGRGFEAKIRPLRCDLNRTTQAEVSVLAELKQVYLQDTPISNAGAPGTLNSLAPMIEALDVSNTLLSSWDAMAEVAIELPLLQTLRSCKNRWVKLCSYRSGRILVVILRLVHVFGVFRCCYLVS